MTVKRISNEKGKFDELLNKFSYLKDQLGKPYDGKIFNAGNSGGLSGGTQTNLVGENTGQTAEETVGYETPIDTGMEDPNAPYDEPIVAPEDDTSPPTDDYPSDYPYDSPYDYYGDYPYHYPYYDPYYSPYYYQPWYQNPYYGQTWPRRDFTEPGPWSYPDWWWRRGAGKVDWQIPDDQIPQYESPELPGPFGFYSTTSGAAALPGEFIDQAAEAANEEELTGVSVGDLVQALSGGPKINR